MNFNWSKLNIDVSHIRREGKTTCPVCGPFRKNKRDKSLSVNVITGDYNCHNTPCEFRGNADDTFLESKRTKKEFVKPLPCLQLVSDKTLKWFEARGISNSTLLQMKVTESPNEWMPQDQKHYTCICFNYYRNGELVNIKFRNGRKDFKLSKDAELIFYNLDCLKDRQRKTVTIVEGEMDALTLVECGLYSVISVPNGANQLRPGVAPRLEYLDNCWSELANVESIIIATDNDQAGELLKQELIRRLGPDRCYTISFPEGCKDPNEVLVKHGKQAVRDLFLESNIKEVPVEGVMTMRDMRADADAIYNYGYPEAFGVGWDIDVHFKALPGDTTVITGIPNHGKSTLWNNYMVQMSIENGWRWAIFSPEKNRGGFLPAELAATYIGRPTYKKNPDEKMTPEEWERAMQFIEEHFLFVKTTGVDLTLDGLLGIGSRMVKRFGINGYTIDPWNYVETDIPPGQTETVWLGNQLGKAGEWAKSVNVHLAFVAHPVKMPKHPKTHKFLQPTMYDISGSAHWNNKIDNGLCVYRNWEDGTTTVHILKVRWFFVGRAGGSVKMKFDPSCQRFTDFVPTDPAQQSYEDMKANKLMAERAREKITQTTEFKPIEQADLPF